LSSLPAIASLVFYLHNDLAAGTDIGYAVVTEMPSTYYSAVNLLGAGLWPRTQRIVRAGPYTVSGFYCALLAGTGFTYFWEVKDVWFAREGTPEARPLNEVCAVDDWQTPSDIHPPAWALN